MSVPCATAPMPVATDTAAPPLEPPDVIAVLHGFSVRPYSGPSVNHLNENGGTLVRPLMIASARRRLATTALSAGATRCEYAGTPLVVASPNTSTFSLIVIGTPHSMPA